MNYKHPTLQTVQDEVQRLLPAEPASTRHREATDVIAIVPLMLSVLMLASTHVATFGASDYRKLADERCANSDFRGAIKALKQDVALRKRTDSAGVPDSLLLQGNVRRLAGDYKGAEKLIATGIRMLEAYTKQGDTPDVKRLSAAYNYLALLDNNSGHYAKSESNARKALRLAQSAMLGKDVEAMHCVVLANALRQQGKYDEALAILAPAVETLKTSPENAVLLGTATNNLGALFFWMGNYPKALVTLNEGLVLRTAATGAEHPDVASSLIDLPTFIAQLLIGRFILLVTTGSGKLGEFEAE